jgi:superfamily II DNA helicase RecQ
MGVNSGFNLYVRRSFDRKRLSRVVFDECHTILQDADFRAKFRKLRCLEFGVQNVYLTATMPPSQGSRFLSFCRLKQETTLVIRALTNRPYMQYEVRVVEDVQAALAKEILGMKWEDGDKGIVFCGTVNETEGFSKKLGPMCSTAYHAHLKEKEENLQAWIDGVGLVICDWEVSRFRCLPNAGVRGVCILALLL